MSDEPARRKSFVIKFIVVMFILVLIVVGLTLLLVDTANEEVQNQPTPSSSGVNAPSASEEGSIPAEPTNRNVEGGTSAGGTGESNTESSPTPSPAGGTDANGVPAQ